MDLLDRLLGHDAQTTRQVLIRCRELDPAALRQPFDIGHGTIEATLVPMIGNVRTWTRLMHGDDLRSGQLAWDGLSVDDLLARHDAVSAGFAALARRIREAGEFDARWVDRLDDPLAEKTDGGAIAHVITHERHHRGELLHILARLGLRDVPEGDLLSWETATRASMP